MGRWLKRAAVGLLAFFAVAGIAHAAPALQKNVAAFTGGLWILKAGQAYSAANKITNAPGSAATAIDFAGVTDACEDSSGITVTGAVAGDACTVGTPATMAHANAWVTCYVSAANTVKVRLCAHGASGNPASATYYVRTFSSQ